MEPVFLQQELDGVIQQITARRDIMIDSRLESLGFDTTSPFLFPQSQARNWPNCPGCPVSCWRELSLYLLWTKVSSNSLPSSSPSPYPEPGAGTSSSGDSSRWFLAPHPAAAARDHGSDASSESATDAST